MTGAIELRQILTHDIDYEFDVYKKHRGGHLNKFPCACGKCTYSCDRIQEFERHTQCHTFEYFERKQPRVICSSRPRPSEANGVTREENNEKEKEESNRNNSLVEMRSYSCKDPNCPQTFQSMADLELHILRHERKSEFRCHLCTFTSTSLGLMQRHLEMHDKNANRRGTSDSKEFHQRSAASSSSPRVCSPLPELPEQTPIYLPSENRFMCPSTNCPMVMSAAKDVSIHLSQHKIPKHPFQCNMCSYSARNGFHLSQHKVLHLKNKVFLELKAQLSGRQSQAESSTSQAPKLTRCPKPYTSASRGPIYKCADSNCPQTFYKRSDALKHSINLHSGTGIFKCDQCTFSSSVYYFDKHKEKHLQAVPDSSLKALDINMHTSFTATPEQSIQHRNPTLHGLKFKPAVYRPAWFKKTKSRKTPIELGRRHRRNLIKDGLVTPTELEVIRKGNPKFTYETHVTYSTGRVVTVNFRCFHCPKAFDKFQSYNKHQRTHTIKLRKNSAWTCGFCNNECNDEDDFRLHCIQHASTTKCWIDVNRCSIPDSEAQADPGGSFYCTRDGTREDNSRKIGNPFDDGILETPDFRLISMIEAHNFMKFDTFAFMPDDGCNLCGLQGVHDCGKSSIILACLIGMAYDLLLDLNQNSTLCGVSLDRILRHGASSGYVELTLELNPYKSLLKKYGSQLKLRRNFVQGRALSESKFEISYGIVSKEIIKTEDVKGIMNRILPPYALRLMVLSTENLDYFLQTSISCNDIFWTVASHQENHLRQKLEAVRDQIEQISIDLESRQTRISFLKDSLKVCAQEDKMETDWGRTLRGMQAEEYKAAQEQYTILEDEFQRLVEEEDSLSTKMDTCLEKLVDKMRKPFKEYILAQNYVGDFVISTDPKEFGIWMKDIRSSETESPKTMDEVRRIWRKEMLVGHRRLAITALFIGFWRILKTCPIMIGDTYSTNPSEFSLPDSSMPLLVDTIRECPNRQFFISIPGESPDEFVQKYT